jgi:hypothetical protein
LPSPLAKSGTERVERRNASNGDLPIASQTTTGQFHKLLN